MGGFDKFWEAYPKKRGKADAIKVWGKLKISNGLVDVVVAAVERQKQWPDWKKESGQFVPDPAKWLRGNRWNDEEGEDREESGPGWQTWVKWKPPIDDED